MSEGNEEQFRLDISFERTEAGQLRISSVDRSDAPNVRVGDVVDSIEVDDGLPAAPPEEILAGWVDGSRPRRRDFEITMSLRRAGEPVTVKLPWLDCMSDEAAAVAPVGATIADDDEQSYGGKLPERPADAPDVLARPSDDRDTLTIVSGPSRDHTMAQSNRARLGLMPHSEAFDKFIADQKRDSRDIKRRMIGCAVSDYHPYREMYAEFF